MFKVFLVVELVHHSGRVFGKRLAAKQDFIDLEDENSHMDVDPAICDDEHFKIVTDTPDHKEFKYKHKDTEFNNYTFVYNKYRVNWYLDKFNGQSLDPLLAYLKHEAVSFWEMRLGKVYTLELDEFYPRLVRQAARIKYKQDNALKHLEESDIVHTLSCFSHSFNANGDLFLADASDQKASFMLKYGMTWYESQGLHCDDYSCDLFRTLKDSTISPQVFKAWLLSKIEIDLQMDQPSQDFINALDKVGATKLGAFVDALEHTMVQKSVWLDPAVQPRLVDKLEFKLIVKFQVAAGNWIYIPHYDLDMLDEEEYTSCPEFAALHSDEQTACLLALHAREAPSLEDRLKDFVDKPLSHYAKPINHVPGYETYAEKFYKQYEQYRKKASKKRGRALHPCPW